MSRKQPLDWFIGEDRTYEFTIYDGNSSGAAVVNITGFAFQWVLLDSTRTVLVTKTVGSGIMITDGSNGVLQVAIDDTDTDSLTAATTYYYELKRNDAGSEVVVAYGTVNLRPQGG